MPWRSRVEELKDLSGRTTVDRLGDLEIFRSAQDDTLVVSVSSLMSLMSLKSLGADCPYITGYKNVTRKRVGAWLIFGCAWGRVGERARAEHKGKAQGQSTRAKRQGIAQGQSVKA